ncbi:MAG: hypothetical protein NWE84_06690 [Candidatus Bathyarchaeota archaeon]|nr:hypothetical protein [Candidatus Bathyarchaeota archaeon]
MCVFQKFGGKGECRQMFLETISSMNVLEVQKLEIVAVATVPTLFFLEDLKQR